MGQGKKAGINKTEKIDGGLQMIIKNGAVFGEDGLFQVRDLYIENHKIVASREEVSDDTQLDAQGLYVIPGLIDIHSHGADGHDFSDGDVDGLRAILKYEKEHGITSYKSDRSHVVL